MPELNERQRLLAQALVLLDHTAFKLIATPLRVELDADFLESVVLFIGAVQSHLERSDTIPAEAPCTCARVISYGEQRVTVTALDCPQHDVCGCCGQVRAVCTCA
jgi:hypothetical protein